MVRFSVMKESLFHNFVLVLCCVSEPVDTIEDALFESGCDDAILSSRNGVTYLEFDRKAETLQAAILSAVLDVEKTEVGVKVVRVEPGDFVNAAEIARRLEYTREYIRLLTQGKRGKGDFPAPQSGILSKTLVWSWVEVVRWLFERKMITNENVLQKAEAIRDFNDALELRHNPAVMSRRLEYMRKLSVGQPSKK